MRYFFDFDRTVFDTPSFKKEFARHPSLRELLGQVKALVAEILDPHKRVSFRHIVMRTLGTYASHRRFGFAEHELKEYLYPDAVEFFKAHGKDCVIVTYGVRAFITAKVANALSEFPLAGIVYTHRKKGRTIKRLTKGQRGPFVFVDDAHFQLESVSETCPEVEVVEMRRDKGTGDGRWPVIHSFDELHKGDASPEVDIPTAKIGVILNTASGSTEFMAEENVRAILKEAGAEHVNIWSASASSVDKAFEKAAAYAPDILIVLGGDGTIRAAAEACTSAGPLLIPLPGGTMNMLPKALYGTRTWDEALHDTLLHPHVQAVSGGSVEGKQFFIAAIAGAPTLWTHAREAFRNGNLKEAIRNARHALRNMFIGTIRYTFSKEHKGNTEAVAIICPLISSVLSNTDRSFEAAAISVKGAGEVLGLASSAAFGKWRDDRRVTVVKTQEVEISSNKELPLILDGEAVQLGSRVRATFVPVAFKVLVPRKAVRALL